MILPIGMTIGKTRMTSNYAILISQASQDAPERMHRVKHARGTYHEGERVPKFGQIFGVGELVSPCCLRLRPHGIDLFY